MAKDSYSHKRDQENASSERNASTGSSYNLFSLITRMTKASKTSTITSVDIVVHSGVSEHVLSDRSYLADTQQVSPITVELASGTSIIITLKRKKELNTGIRRVKIANAYNIRTMKMNISSCWRLHERVVITKIERRMCTLLDRTDGKMFAWIRGRQTDGLFITKIKTRADFAVGNIGVLRSHSPATTLTQTGLRVLCGIKEWGKQMKKLRSMLSSKTYGTSFAEKPCTRN